MRLSLPGRGGPDFSVPKMGFGRKIPKSIFCAKSVRRGILLKLLKDLDCRQGSKISGRVT